MGRSSVWTRLVVGICCQLAAHASVLAGKEESKLDSVYAPGVIPVQTVPVAPVQRIPITGKRESPTTGQRIELRWFAEESGGSWGGFKGEFSVSDPERGSAFAMTPCKRAPRLA